MEKWLSSTVKEIISGVIVGVFSASLTAYVSIQVIETRLDYMERDIAKMLKISERVEKLQMQSEKLLLHVEIYGQRLDQLEAKSL